MDRFVDKEPTDAEPPAKPPAKPAKPAAKAKEGPPKTEKPAPKPEKPVAAAPDPEEPELAAEGEEGTAAPEQDPSKPADGRPKPWPLVEKFKTENAQLKKQLAEIQIAQKAGELPKEHLERFNALETRNKELEEEIRHVNYSKSKDFEDTYKKPYEVAWKRALSDLSELTVSAADGSERAATAQDMVRLANMPLKEAWTQAKDWFGEAASAVMNHRDKLKDLSDKQASALEDARKNGGEREKKQTLEQQAKDHAQRESTSKFWQTVNAEAVEKFEFLRPVEGETERNEFLEKAVKFVDETFGLHANQAKTEEERQQIIRRHSALRNRAIGFSVLNYENKSLRSEIAALKKSLEEFQGSEPTAGEHRRTQNGEPTGDIMEASLAQLAKLAS